ncbi:hypothetical protein ACF090_35540 [Streptomyces sp. NPDC014892]|uniref:hypothetical protein n=1 Tax=Streptomyces sp. NPDC014892 TaxID=3364930 RepID=UPI0036F7FAC2
MPLRSATGISRNHCRTTRTGRSWRRAPSCAVILPERMSARVRIRSVGEISEASVEAFKGRVLSVAFTGVVVEPS